ncbi:hypothetical protein [Cohnella sp. AR92]|uniref:alpha/beta hydrolase family protein n=1 Tax=Cohnella sp. AR92 TaxID=648716 RepID=UPI000F8CD60E|nr:hypothetical protein [Cohnella sp. AR92]RUS48577.1 hypothetical protein ELR57_03960 [Cohnella sp. AR92]
MTSFPGGGMREWEVVLLAMQTVVCFLPRRSSKLLRTVCWLLPVPLAIHLAVEGGRWQMGPAYLFVLWAVLDAALGKSKPPVLSSRRHRRAGWVFVIVFLLASWMLPYLLPVPQLEVPPGPYPVGTVIYHWVDRSRMEQTPGKTNPYREINVQLWYPARASQAKKQADYIPELPELSRYAQQRWHLPSTLLSYLNLAKTFTYEDADLPEGTREYPVIVLSHGWPGLRFAYHYLETGLASRGYVVAAVEHTYGTPAAVFPDGRVEAMGASPPEFNLPAWDEIIDNVWSKDDSFVLDQLGKLNAGASGGRFRHRLNLEQAGVIGHSFGGDNALAALRQDKRFKAGISLDGSFYGDGAKPLSADQSFLWMCTDAYLKGLGLPKPNNRQLADEGISRSDYERWVEKFGRRRDEAMAEGGQTLLVRDARHSSFSDSYLFTPILQWRAKAPGSQKIHRTVLSYVSAFMDEHLTNKTPGGLEREARQDNRVLLIPRPHP